MFTILIVGFVLVVVFLFITTRGQADLTLLFWEIFGTSLDSFEGQVVWITGASSGIGEGLAYVLAENKAKLILSARNEDALNRIKRTCLEITKTLKEDDILVLPFDISNFAAHKKSFDIAIKHFGRLDVLVNNAGRSQRSNFEDIDIEVHEEIYRTNALGPVNLTKIVLPHFMERKHGHVVVTSSTAGIIGAPFSASYTGSKHALHGYFESLRAEKVHDSITITIVCPGPVESKIVENACTGKIGETYQNPVKNPARRKCVTNSRCSKLMACAIVNKLDQVWIATQPVLLSHYLAQYTPSFFRNTVLKMVLSKKMFEKLRDGKD